MPVTPGAAGGPVVSTQHSQLATVEGSIALREHKHPNVLIRSPSVLGICEVRDNTIFVREGRCFKRSSFTPVLLFKGDAIVRAKLASPLRYAKRPCHWLCRDHPLFKICVCLSCPTKRVHHSAARAGTHDIRANPVLLRRSAQVRTRTQSRPDVAAGWSAQCREMRVRQSLRAPCSRIEGTRGPWRGWRAMAGAAADRRRVGGRTHSRWFAWLHAATRIGLLRRAARDGQQSCSGKDAKVPVERAGREEPRVRAKLDRSDRCGVVLP